MPILERDPWRMQYFERVSCPDEVKIPTDDFDAYELFPAHRWVYNKLRICETQGIRHAPHGIEPPAFPVFSKPVYNMKGMGVGSRVIESTEQYEHDYAPGHMWMEMLNGEHVSTDLAVVDGEPRWWRHTIGKPLEGGMFDYWTVLAESRPGIEEYVSEWLGRNLRGYTGALNVETIGGRIIECHLRFADQWPDLYGSGWVDSQVKLYQFGRWEFCDENRRNGYSVVLFGGHGLSYPRPDAAVIEELLRNHGQVSSIQITFHPEKPPEQHNMPPGGFRLAVVNCSELEVGIKARERLALHFWSTQKLRPRKPAGARQAAQVDGS